MNQRSSVVGWPAHTDCMVFGRIFSKVPSFIQSMAYCLPLESVEIIPL